MNLPHLRLILLIIISAGLACQASAQRRNSKYVAYINQYKDLAIEQMNEYRIPASITLAQGLLESGAGTSRLARNSNNHFGIKCGSSWRGRTVRHDDDRRNECFRAYKNPKDSYIDHSRFLTTGARYAFLFRLETTDYKGWAKGLKKAGYATDPSYANRLITIIEDYELYKYDSSDKRWRKTKTLAQPHPVYLANGLAYIVARKGDSFESLSDEFGIRAKNLAKYNDLHKKYVLQPGDIIYLKSKNKKATKEYESYTVRDGDSMHSISQMFGIRLENLYKMNKKDGDYIPEIGDRLRLR